ncbi:MAG TPA: TnpV protein [Bacillota bacterium]|nr:TnpV protein [Bacillota bacterium]
MESIKTVNGITYELRGEQYYPCLTVPEKKQYPIGKYGSLRLDFIKAHRRGTYATLVSEVRLNEHLHDVDVQAHEILDNLLPAMAKSRGIDEKMKADDMLRWVQEMNNCKSAVEEIIYNELIYC